MQLTDFDVHMIGIAKTFQTDPDKAHHLFAKAVETFKTKFVITDQNPNNNWSDIADTFIWVLNPQNKFWYPYIAVM